MTCGTQVTGGVGWYSRREHFRVETGCFSHNSRTLDKPKDRKRKATWIQADLTENLQI